jgi:hypothetical protein
MIFGRCARAQGFFYASVLLAAIAVTAAGCDPGAILGLSGDAGSTQFVPNYNEAPPAHQAGLPCGDPDNTHLCIALNYVTYQDSSGQPIVNRAQATSNVQNINTVWDQCHVQFYLENYTAADPVNYKLDFAPSTSDELGNVRSAFTDHSRLTVVTTGQWTGQLGSQAPNAWTEMPPVGPFGTVLEASVADVGNLIAHELGHYLNLQHVTDVYDVMNPVVYSNSINLTDDQCSMARATAISFWGSALR